MDSNDATIEQPTNVRWIVFTLGCGTSWMLYLHRYTLALIKPELKKDFGLSTEELGYLDSAFSFCYSVFQFPCGILADTMGAHIYLGSIILIWSVALGMHAFAPGLKTLWFARSLFGAGQAGAFAAIGRVTRTWFPLSIRTSVQGCMGVFFGRFGGMSANLLFAFLMIGIFHLNWRTAIYLLTGIGIVHGLAFLLLFRNSPRNHPWANRAEADFIEDVEAGAGSTDTDGERSNEVKPARQGTLAMLRGLRLRALVNLMCVNLASTMSTIADNIYSNWIPLFLAEVHGLNYKEMGLYSAMPLLGGALGGVFSGFLNDYLIRRTGNRRWTRSLIGAFGKGTAAVLLLIAMQYYDQPYTFCRFLFFVKFFADISLATRWGTITDISGNATASVFAFNNSVAGIGAIAAPTLYGIVAGSDEYGWKWVFIIAIAAYILCSISWLLVNCTIPLFGAADTGQRDAEV